MVVPSIGGVGSLPRTSQTCCAPCGRPILCCAEAVQSALSSSGGTALYRGLGLVRPWQGRVRVFLRRHLGPDKTAFKNILLPSRALSNALPAAPEIVFS